MKHARRRVESEESFGLRDTLIWCGIPIVIVLLVRMFLFGFYVIPSGSMLNTIEPGDRVITSKLTPKVFKLQRGDVVVFKDPDHWLQQENSGRFGGDYLIKRLIGLPGDTVACEGPGKPVTVNGVAIDETSYIRSGVDPSSFAFSEKVTAGHVFVMGDNRANSADSRYHQDDSSHGLVPVSDVVGVGLVKYWPLNHISTGRASRRVRRRSGRICRLMSVSVMPTLDMERAIASSGYDVIVGFDEVGRGSLAGPVMVGAAAICACDLDGSGPSPLRRGSADGVADSKMLTNTSAKPSSKNSNNGARHGRSARPAIRKSTNGAFPAHWRRRTARARPSGTKTRHWRDRRRWQDLLNHRQAVKVKIGAILRRTERLHHQSTEHLRRA